MTVEDDEAGSIDEETAEQATPTPGDGAIGTQDLTAWLGRKVVDVTGEPVGRLDDVYFDIDSDQPQFGIVVQGGLVHHRRFVPLSGAQVGPESVQIAVTKQEVKDAPGIDATDGQLTAEDESALYHHYRLNYVASDRESGRKLVRH
jgi:sporulation protein YlmC with PRC-barrel domain